MHITNQKLRFDIFTVQNIFMEHDLNILMIFGIKDTFIILTHTMYFLAIAINIPQRLKTAFVLQGHVYFLPYSVIKMDTNKSVCSVYIYIYIYIYILTVQ